jgi:hypothetical protein
VKYRDCFMRGLSSQQDQKALFEAFVESLLADLGRDLSRMLPNEVGRSSAGGRGGRPVEQGGVVTTKEEEEERNRLESRAWCGVSEPECRLGSERRRR